jgi:hypothetical protein
MSNRIIGTSVFAFALLRYGKGGFYEIRVEIFWGIGFVVVGSLRVVIAGGFPQGS